MYSPNGYICILERDSSLRIPADTHRLKDIPALLRSVWLLKVGTYRVLCGEESLLTKNCQKTMSDSVAIVRGSDSKNAP